MTVSLTRTRRRILTSIVLNMVDEKRREARDQIDRELLERTPRAD
jgi:hypothetical protein